MTIRWGILGCGDVAEKKSGPALYMAPGSALHAVMRRDKAKAEDFARRHGAAVAYDNVDDLLADPYVDAVYIATPPHLHCAQTVAAARAGKRVLVEKPMALDFAECQTMISACKEADVSLHVAYYRRFYPKFVFAKKMLDDGAIGAVLGANLLMRQMSGSGGWRVDPKVSGGGHFVDVGSHRLDMTLYLLGGDLSGAAGFAQNHLKLHDAENDVSVSFQTTTGAVVSAGFHFHTRPACDILEIIGSAGTLRFAPFDGETFSVFTASGETTHSFPNPSPAHLPFIAALVNVYKGAELPHVTGEEGAKATQIMDAALAGFSNNPRR